MQTFGLYAFVDGCQQEYHLFLLPDNLVKGLSMANGPTQEPWRPKARVCSTSPWGVPRDPRGLALRIRLLPACLISLLPNPAPSDPILTSYVSPKPHTHISLLDFKQLQQPLLLQKASWLEGRWPFLLTPTLTFIYAFLAVRIEDNKPNIQHRAWQGRASRND